MDSIDETAGILTLDGKQYDMNKLPPTITVRACLEGLKVKIRAAKDRKELWKTMMSGRWPTRKRNKFPAGVQVLAWLTEVDIDTAWERFQQMDKKAKRVLARHPAAKVVQMGGFSPNVGTKALKSLLVLAIDKATNIEETPGDGSGPPPPMPVTGELAMQHSGKKKKGKVIRKGQAKTPNSSSPVAQ